MIPTMASRHRRRERPKLGLTEVCGRAAVAALVVATAAPSAWAADRALIVAIDTYQMESLNLPAGSSLADARDLKTLAVEHLGYSAENVKLLLNEEATHDGILAAIDDWLIAGTEAGDRVLFTYSGHGTETKDQDGDEEDGRDEALVPWDTGMAIGGEPTNLLLDDTLRERFARLSDRQALVLVDSCHSGTVTRAVVGSGDGDDATPVARNAAALRRLRGTTRGLIPLGDDILPPDAHANNFIPMEDAKTVRVFTAAAAHEVAYVDPATAPAQGIFTRSLIKAVGEGKADTNGNGIISNAEVLTYLQSVSREFCEGFSGCSTLTPTLETSKGLLGQDFRTGNAASSPAAGFGDGLGKPTADLLLGIEPGSRVRQGDTVTFVARPSIDGYLIVLDINANGQVTQLYPNAFTGADNAVRQGQTVRIPDERYDFVFRAVEPLGKGHLVAVLASEQVAPDDLLVAHRDLAVIEDPQDYLNAMAESLVGSWSRQVNGRPLNWGYTQLGYEIMP
ncbi:DUF4384 domain-containing protein [Rhodospira trueperi]|uniref:Caspase domain-containing protein n=1 Tax=Rhodospira trueperi TaxID=69960 RepID=A0A1G7AB48_9PROT|nr:DUF4384 domain-containing protein [Rhodospira trueperi]SDE11265.1 Caspase domain-containing protein [Rhodospira trueperi]